MLGFIVGIAAAFGFMAFKRHGGAWGAGGRGWHSHRRGGRRGGAWRPLMLRALFRRLDTTREQEEVIVDAFDAVQQTARAQREGLHEWRETLARTVSRKDLDDKAIREALDQQDERLATMKGALADAIGKVHGVLDPIQREELAEVVATGMRGGRRMGHSCHGGW